MQAAPRQRSAAREAAPWPWPSGFGPPSSGSPRAFCEKTQNLPSVGSADVDITSRALGSKEPVQPGSPPSPSHPPPTSSYMTSCLGCAAAPQAVLLPICSCASCSPSYLGLHYKGLLYGRAQRFLSFPPVPPPRISLCKRRLLYPAHNFSPAPPPLPSFLLVGAFLATCVSESLPFDACLSVFCFFFFFFLPDAVSHSPPAHLAPHISCFL